MALTPVNEGDIAHAADVNQLVTRLNGGTSFPGTPAVGDRYWRTDRGLEFYWDGTRWLSTQLFSFSLGSKGNVAAADVASTFLGGFAIPSSYAGGIYVVDMWAVLLPTGTNDGSNYFTVTVYKHDGTNSTALGAVNTQAVTTGHWALVAASITAQVATDFLQLYSQASAVGAPGALYMYAGECRFRYVG